MKNVIAIIAASLSLAALGIAQEHTSGYYTPTICVFKKTLTFKNNVVPVRYVSLAGTNENENVKVNEYFSTNCLPNNTYLYLFTNNTYKAYVLNASTGWQPATPVSTINGSTANAGDLTQTLQVGSAAWIQLPSAPGVGETNLVITVGQISSHTNSTIIAGEPNLIANPNGDSGKNIITHLSGIKAKGDTILLLPSVNIPNPSADQIVYNATKGKWYKITMNGKEVAYDEVASLTVGIYQGVWYVSKGSSNLTVDWN